MDDSANISRRGGALRGQQQQHHRSRAIIDNLSKQVNNNSTTSISGNNSSRQRNSTFQRSSDDDGTTSGSNAGIRLNSLLTTTALLQQLRTSLDDVVVVTRRRGRSMSKERTNNDEDNDAARSKSKQDSLTSKSSPGIGLRRRATVGACSSTESLSAAESCSNSDCESLISVLRSYRGGETKGSDGFRERKKGRRKSDVGVGGAGGSGHRRRGSSLSRIAARMLSTMDNNDGETNGSTMEEDDSKASMVYDIPFDPTTGKCHHHPTVQMAVREDSDEKTVKTKKGGDISSSSDSTLVYGWKIVRTTCPKCKYNY